LVILTLQPSLHFPALKGMEGRVVKPALRQGLSARACHQRNCFTHRVTQELSLCSSAWSSLMPFYPNLGPCRATHPVPIEFYGDPSLEAHAKWGTKRPCWTNNDITIIGSHFTAERN
jgi:hypothetical protein